MPPGRLDLDVFLDAEEVFEALVLLVGEQARPGVQGPTSGVEGVAFATTVAVDVLLDAAPAAVQRFTGKAHDVEGIHHRDGVRQRLGGGGLEAGEPVHCHNLQTRSPGLGTVGEPLLECLLRAAFDHVQQPRRPGSRADAGQIDDHGDVLVAAAGVPPVGSARGAVAALLPVRFPGPPAEPGVRLSPQRALHVRLLLSSVVADGVHGVGIR